MSPKSVQQKSIKDHFAIIPKKKLEPKPELKIHPLFIKKSVVKDTKENIAPSPPPTIPKPKKAESPPPLQQRSTSSKNLNVKKETCRQPHPLQDLIHKNTQAFFQKQKNAREIKKPHPSCTTSRPFDRKSVEKWMNDYYPRWNLESCCKVLFENNNVSFNSKTQWCDKYRPNSIEGLIGFLPDYEYLRNWLELLKVSNNEELPKKKKKTMSADEDELFNVILFVGDSGTGKTATAYTVAKETGYTVFEINATSRRAGKDIINQVGEMTASHLVRFNQKKRKNKSDGERIILRDTVKNKKPKTIDIATHFKKMLTVSKTIVEKEEEFEQEQEKMELKEEKKKPPSPPTIDNESNTNVTMTEISTTKIVTEDISITDTTAQNEEAEDVIMQDAPKQSLVLLEEVDLLFEEDKGFWTAVIELCQKSKRPIIMTCNDESKIPFDYLDIQSTIYFELPEKSCLLPYLQLICFAEKWIVKPYDIEYLCELYLYDIRKLICVLQLWLNKSHVEEENVYMEYPNLFAHMMGFSDLIEEDEKKNSLMKLMDRLKGSSEKMKELCVKYYNEYNKKEEEDVEVTGIEHISKMMENASFSDAFIGLTDKQRHQIYDIDQYDNKTDMIISTNDTLLYKNATDLDHWELGEIIENSISAMNLNQGNCSSIWRNQISAWSSHWEHLCNTSKDSLLECTNIISPLSLLQQQQSQVGSLVFMMEYMPNIRSMCLHDEGIAAPTISKTTKRSSRKNLRYIKLDDESRDIIINRQQI